MNVVNIHYISVTKLGGKLSITFRSIV